MSFGDRHDGDQPRRGRAGLPTTYQVDWLLGDLPKDPLEYARQLSRSWIGKPLAIRSLRVRTVVTGHVRVSFEADAQDAAEAMDKWAHFVLAAVSERHLAPPGYVLSLAAVRLHPS